MKGYAWKQYESFAKSLNPDDATRFWLMLTAISARRGALYMVVAAFGSALTAVAVILR